MIRIHQYFRTIYQMWTAEPFRVEVFSSWLGLVFSMQHRAQACAPAQPASRGRDTSLPILWAMNCCPKNVGAAPFPSPPHSLILWMHSG